MLERFSLDCRKGLVLVLVLVLLRFTTPFGWLVYLLWFWFYDENRSKTVLLQVCKIVFFFFNIVGICPAAGKGLKTSKCPEVRKFSRISEKSLSLDHYFEFILSSFSQLLSDQENKSEWLHS